MAENVRLHLTSYNSELNSTLPTEVVRLGKFDPRSYSPARLSGFPANLIAVTLLNLDVETIKVFYFFLNFRFDVISVYFLAHFFYCLYFSRLLLTKLLFKTYCYELIECTS